MFAFLAEVPAAGGRLGAPAAGRNSATRLEETKSPTVGGPRLVSRSNGLCVALPTYEGDWVHGKPWGALDRMGLWPRHLVGVRARLREQFNGSKQQKLPTIDKLPTMRLASEQPDHQQQLQPQRGVPAFFAFLVDVPAARGRQSAPAAGRSGATIGAIGGGSSGAGASAAAPPLRAVPDVVRRSARWSDKVVNGV